MIGLASRCAVLVLLLVLAGCGGGGDSETSAASGTARHSALSAPPQTTPAVPLITLGNLVKQGETRVGRTVYDYVFSITVANSGAEAADVKLTVTGTGPGTTVVDGEIKVGNLPATAGLITSDTITLRHDRSVPFSPQALQWQIRIAATGSAVERDEDRNGVRDDVDDLVRRIAAGDAQRLVALERFASSLQKSVDADAAVDSATAKGLLLAELDAGRCMAGALPEAELTAVRRTLFWSTFDTEARRKKRQVLLDAAGAFVLPEEATPCQ